MYDPLELVERSSDPAFLVDGTLEILAWNSHAEALLGISSREAVNQTCYGLLEGETAEGRAICGPRCAAAGCFLSDSPFSHGRLIVRGPGDAKIPLQVSTIVLPGPLTRGVPKAVILMRPIEARGEALSAVPPVPLKIHALGQLRIYQGVHSVSWQHWPRQQAVSLFKMLVSRRGRPVHRDALVEGLWPGVGPQEGFKRLKVVVHALRRCLEPHREACGVDGLVVTEGECYCLPLGPHLWVDADEFQRLALAGDEAVRKGAAAEALKLYRQARELYLGDYLEGDLYSDWVAVERERLLELHLAMLVKTASLFVETRQWEQAVEACQAAIGLDPCRENVHRLLMQCLWEAGRQSEALRQYGYCREVLRRELGVEPMAETVVLYRRLVEHSKTMIAS